jgi:hypothetical protein
LQSPQEQGRLRLVGYSDDRYQAVGDLQLPGGFC